MGYRYISPNVKQEIINQFKNGKAIKDLHKEFGVAFNSLYRWTNEKSLGDKRKHIRQKSNKSVNVDNMEVSSLVSSISSLESFVSGMEQLCQEYHQFQLEKKSFQKEKENYNNIIAQLKHNTENLLAQM